MDRRVQISQGSFLWDVGIVTSWNLIAFAWRFGRFPVRFLFSESRQHCVVGKLGTFVLERRREDAEL